MKNFFFYQHLEFFLIMLLLGMRIKYSHVSLNEGTHSEKHALGGLTSG